MKIKYPLLTIVVIISIGMVIFGEAISLNIIPDAVPTNIRFLLPWVSLASLIILSPVYKKFNDTFNFSTDKMTEKDNLRSRLEKFGKVPMRLFMFNFGANAVLLIFASLIVMGVYGNVSLYTEIYVNITLELVLFIFLMLSLFGLGGAALYVWADALFSKVLSRQNIAQYPLSLKVNRQYFKFILVPILAMVLGFIVATSAGYYGVLKTLTGPQRVGVTMNNILLYSLPLIIGYLVPIVALARGWAGGMSNSFSSVLTQLDGMLAGERDLTKRITISSVDEIASIAARVNAFTRVLNTMIKDVTDNADTMESAAQTLSNNASSISTGVSTIANDIINLNYAAEEQSASVTETASTVTQIARNIESLANQIENQSSVVTQSSAAVQKMVANVGEISKNISRADNGLEELKVTAVDGKMTLSNVQNLVNRLSEQSGSLLDATNVIDNIAAQTNLLAMNAAIEAAHAGIAEKVLLL